MLMTGMQHAIGQRILRILHISTHSLTDGMTGGLLEATW